MPRILIVDDEAAIRSLLALAFGRAGYEVRTAAHAAHAMEICASEPLDAILSDVQMPGMDGHTLVRWVAAQHPHVRSAMMSGHDMHCLDCPFEGRCTLLRKPFAPSAAVAAVDAVLSAR